MKIFTVRRFPEIADGTFGAMFDESVPFAVTLEPVWKNNLPESCIPAGEYICKRFHSARHPNTFEVTGVVGRTGILFHKGNTATPDTAGCILIAEKFGLISGVPAIQQSGEGFDEFLRRTNGIEEFKLVILY